MYWWEKYSRQLNESLRSPRKRKLLSDSGSTMACFPDLPCRPDRNAARMAAGAARLSMPPVPEEQFVQAVADTVRANAGEQSC